MHVTIIAMTNRGSFKAQFPISFPSKLSRFSLQCQMPRTIDEDPLTRAIAPPPNESLEERHARELAEAEARRVSDEIDTRLRTEKAAMKKKKKAVKVLLLGQSESGASQSHQLVRR